MDDISPERRAELYMERRPIIGQPFPYNSDNCDLPAEMLFMHDAIYHENEKVNNVDVWEQIKTVTPEIERVWEVVQNLQQRIDMLETRMGRPKDLPTQE